MSLCKNTGRPWDYELDRTAAICSVELGEGRCRIAGCRSPRAVVIRAGGLVDADELGLCARHGQAIGRGLVTLIPRIRRG